MFTIHWEEVVYFLGTIILCTSKDDTVVEYALSRSMSPTMVADYTLHLPDKTLLENRLRELTQALTLESGDAE